MASRLRKFGITAVSAAVGAGFVTWALDMKPPGYIVSAEVKTPPKRKRTLPPRTEQVKALQSGEQYDVLIIGGGATGAGCALDSVTRGLKTALVEMDDFASGTSSRSTKLIHGGVRYLQKAILGLDYEQYRMVKEALEERANMLESAPHLAHPLPIMLPVYQWWQVPYYWVGIKCYDLVAGGRNVKSSYLLSKKEALELFPMLKKDKLCGAIVYYDGQQDDARMALAVALTAARHGAVVCNHTQVTELLKKPDENGNQVLCGAKCKDVITGKEFTVKAKCIINATGPFTDTIRKMDDPTVKTICCPSSGTHIVLPGYYSPEQMGLLDPSTSDGRVIFFLPWQRQTIAGTTDTPCEVTRTPAPTDDEINFILTEIKHYLNADVDVRRGDVLSAWCGIRPLVSDPNKGDTQSLARNHIVHVSPSKLITIAGGKWTTYRAMAEHTIDAAIKACNLKPERPESVTHLLKIEGGQGWTPTMYIRLVQDFGLECEVAQHLAKTYGDRAFAVAKMASLTGKRWPIIGNKIHPEFPYIDAEIKYGVREYAMNAVDMIARRLRLAFLNAQAAQEALPAIVDIMGEELKWSKDEKEKQIKKAKDFLALEMGQQVSTKTRDLALDLTKDEVSMYTKRFSIIDKDKKGFVSINDIRRALKGDNGSIFMEMVFTNKVMQPLSDFAIQFNTNSFGLAPAGAINIATILPNQSANVELPCRTNGEARKTDPLTSLQVAVKDNLDVFYFAVIVPLHMYFDDNGHMDKRDFLQLWQEIPEQNEQNYTLQNNMNFSADDICTKLQQNNIFTVARRNVEGQELLYHSIKYTNNIFILSELKMQANSPTITLSLKSRHLTAIANLNEVYQTILSQ